MENKPNRIIWHHSGDASSGHQADKIDRYHKSLKFPLSILGFYGGYHVLIEKDGTVFRYRADNEIGAHDAGENINSLGVCLAGNFNLEKPTREQELALTPLLKKWTETWSISIERIDPHRVGDSTDCPGKLLSDTWPRELLRAAKSTDPKQDLRDILNFVQAKLNA